MSERQKAASELGITNRELEIIRLCAEGMSAVQIAETLFISPRTVNNHKQNIFSKMEVGNNAQMVQKARELGLI
jgi:DNA-binding CsgD family transcriptional regulator